MLLFQFFFLIFLIYNAKLITNPIPHVFLMHKQHLAPLKIPQINATPQKPITKDDTECHNKNPSAPLRKSHSKQDFRKPIVNTSKLPVGFFSVNKTGSPSFSNSPKTKPSNPIVPLKKFLCLEREQEIGGTPSCFRRKYQDVIVKARESFNQTNSNIEEFVGIRLLSKKENTRKNLYSMQFPLNFSF